MATLLIVCFSINSSSNMANANVRKALKCGFTVNAKTLENGLDENIVNQILNIDGITDSYNLRSYTVAAYSDVSNNKLKTRDDVGLKVYENAGRVVGDRYSEKDNYFTEEGFKLINGEHITPDKKQVALIHEDLANRNNLDIGDYILLNNVEGNEEKPVLLADELTGNLDEETANSIMEILKDCSHKMNKCVVIVTHSKDLAKQTDVIFRLWRDELEIEDKK